MHIHKKNSKWLCLAGLMAYAFVSCSDDNNLTADPNSDWAVRNSAYIDSIANVATNPPSGETWYRYVNYKIQNEGSGINLTLSNSDYIYVKDLTEAGTELGETPLATDTVEVHYRGWYVNGTVFDQSFSGDWNADIHVPTAFSASGVVTGWTTALIHMQENEHWEIYIPYTMGYGTSDYSSIPAYSTLIFDLRLEKVRHPIGPDDRLRKAKELQAE